MAADNHQSVDDSAESTLETPEMKSRTLKPGKTIAVGISTVLLSFALSKGGAVNAHDDDITATAEPSQPIIQAEAPTPQPQPTEILVPVEETYTPATGDEDVVTTSTEAPMTSTPEASATQPAAIPTQAPVENTNNQNNPGQQPMQQNAPVEQAQEEPAEAEILPTATPKIIIETATQIGTKLIGGMERGFDPASISALEEDVNALNAQCPVAMHTYLDISGSMIEELEALRNGFTNALNDPLMPEGLNHYLTTFVTSLNNLVIDGTAAHAAASLSNVQLDRIEYIEQHLRVLMDNVGFFSAGDTLFMLTDEPANDEYYPEGIRQQSLQEMDAMIGILQAQNLNLNVIITQNTGYLPDGTFGLVFSTQTLRYWHELQARALTRGLAVNLHFAKTASEVESIVKDTIINCGIVPPPVSTGTQPATITPVTVTPTAIMTASAIPTAEATATPSPTMTITSLPTHTALPEGVIGTATYTFQLNEPAAASTSAGSEFGAPTPTVTVTETNSVTGECVTYVVGKEQVLDSNGEVRNLSWWYMQGAEDVKYYSEEGVVDASTDGISFTQLNLENGDIIRTRIEGGQVAIWRHDSESESFNPLDRDHYNSEVTNEQLSDWVNSITGGDDSYFLNVFDSRLGKFTFTDAKGTMFMMDINGNLYAYDYLDSYDMIPTCTIEGVHIAEITDVTGNQVLRVLNSTPTHAFVVYPDGTKGWLRNGQAYSQVIKGADLGVIVSEDLN